MTQTAVMPSYPMARGCPFDPPAELAKLRETTPITRVTLWDGTQPWLVTDHADVRALLADRRLSADIGTPGFPLLSPSQTAAQANPHTVNFVFMDDPEHARLREMLTRDFVVKRAALMRPMVQAMVDGVLDRMLAQTPPVDVVTELALPVPSLVIASLLGVPYERHHDFQRLSSVVFSRESTAEEVTQARDELRDLLNAVVEDRIAVPADDLLSRLATERVETGQLRRDQLVPIAVLLLIAGLEPTANMTSLSLLSLLDDRTRWEQLAADPSLIPGAVEELLRFHSIVQTGVPRVATEDVEIGGVTIRSGEGVILNVAAANRDPAQFPGPDELDLTRDAGHHVAFGFGVHQCLGQPLARLELAVVLETVLRRVPSMALAAPVDELAFKDDMAVYGLHSMPVTWGA